MSPAAPPLMLPTLFHTQDGVPGGPSSDDWILEEHVHKDEVYLMDRKTGKLFTNPGEGTWPRAVGECSGGPERARGPGLMVLQTQ